MFEDLFIFIRYLKEMGNHLVSPNKPTALAIDHSNGSDRIAAAVIKSIGVCCSTALMGYIMVKIFKHMNPNKESEELAKKRLAELIQILKLDSKIELNSYEMRIAVQLVPPEEGVDAEEIGGCSEILDKIQQNVLTPLRLEASNIRFQSDFYAPPKGILLYGPPGCGKTLTAKAIAKSANAYFINFDISVLNSMWYGETTKLTKALFTLTTKVRPCVIFIDEIDSVFRERNHLDHEATAVMKTQFMALWDGFHESDGNFIIVGATNRPQDVDDAILRRLPLRLHVPKPNLNSRKEILRVLLRKENVAEDFDYGLVAEATESLSGSDLKEIVRQSCLSCYQTTVQSLINSPEELQQRICDLRISHKDLLTAAEDFKKSAIELKSDGFVMQEYNLD